MSASVSIYAEAVPTVDHVGRWVFLESNVAIRLPIEPDEAAAWCEEFARILTDEARKSREDATRAREALAAARQMVEEARQGARA